MSLFVLRIKEYCDSKFQQYHRTTAVNAKCVTRGEKLIRVNHSQGHWAYFKHI